jgi:transcriptional regulator with XRE-family HTH domain
MNKNKRMLQIRKSEGLTMEKFGEKIKLSTSAINNIEKEKRELTDRSIDDICRVYKVNPNWLKNGIGEMYLDEDTELAKVFDSIMNGDNEVLKRFFLLVKNFDDDEIISLINIAKQFIEQRKKQPVD